MIAVFWMVAGASPAAAHGTSSVDSTNYRTRLKSVRPAVEGVTFRVIETGSRFELRNETDTEVVVIGYQEEPYLRIARDGVFENRKSPAVYLNASRTGTNAIPGSADPKAPPEWAKVSDDNVARWHDHRAHWMSDEDPPSVRRAPDQTHVVIPEWTIPVKLGDQTIEARGDLVWLPGPSPAPWLALAVGLLVVTAALAFTPAWAPLLAVVVGLLAALDVVHALGIGFAKAGTLGDKIGQTLAGSFYSILAWAAAAIAVRLLLKRRSDGLYAAGFAGMFIALYGGVIDFGDLTRSQVPFLWGAPFARALVAVSLGVGLGLIVASVIGLRRHPVPRAPEDAQAPDAAAG